MHKSTRLIGSLLAVSILLPLGSPVFAWSALQYNAKEEVVKHGGRPVIESILKEAEEPANQPTDQSAPNADLSEFDKQVEKPVMAPPQTTEDNAAQSQQSAATPPQTEAAAKPAAPRQAGRQPTEDSIDPDYFYKRARNFVKQNDYQSALNYINKALELYPEFWEAWYEKGLIYQLAGYDGVAAKRYLELIRRHPERPEAHIAMGALYRKHKNYDLAEQEYKDVIDQNFNSFEAHFNYANLLMEQEKYEPALKEYKICLKLQPRNGLVHNNLGVIYEKRKFYEEAIEEYTRASHFEPANQQFANNLAQVKTKVGQKPSRAVQM